MSVSFFVQRQHKGVGSCPEKDSFKLPDSAPGMQMELGMCFSTPRPTDGRRRDTVINGEETLTVGMVRGKSFLQRPRPSGVLRDRPALEQHPCAQP